MVSRDRSWRALTDEEVRHWLAMYRRRLATLDDDEPDPEVRESTRDYLAMLTEDGEAEAARRAVPGRGQALDRFTPAFLADLKARVMLDALCEHELGATLGKPTLGGVRRGPCPICGTSAHSDSFGVHTADPANQWYYCHRCGATGDAISAIMQAYGDPFPRAVERLARYGGVPVPPAPTPRAVKLGGAPKPAGLLVLRKRGA